MTVYRRFSMKLIVSLLVLCMLAACFCAPAFAAGLEPEDKEYEDGNIVLHKQAERIGPDAWKVNVQATIKEEPVQPPRLAVAFVLDVSSTMNACADASQHNQGNGYTHMHTESCLAVGCQSTMHVHVAGKPNSHCYRTGGADGLVFYDTRIDVAKKAISSLSSTLPNGTTVKYVYFSNTQNIGSNDDGYDGVEIEGETYIMNGVDLGIAELKKIDDSKTKILVLVTDGAATDNRYTSDAFEAFDGKVFTVGFNHYDPNLEGMVKNGGAYFTANNPGELTDAFTEIAGKITAMLVDPMGSNVGFEVGSVQKPSSSVNGEVLYTNNTLLWTPSSSTEEFSNATIAYSYTVSLNDQADRSTGSHSGVALNNPTDLRYGISGSAAEDMETAAFPIPEADYEISSVQVNWEYDGQPLKTPTKTETIISDWPGNQFATDYKTITQTIQSGGTDYHYTDTIITRDGMTVEAIDLTQPGAYVVTHKYSLEQLYPVTYEYIGDVPDGAPDPSAHNRSYKQGDTVPVAENPSLEHWVFSGWTVAEGGVVIGSGAFTMPGNAVKLTGSWSLVLADAVVHFVDENGSALREDMTDSQYVGSNYDVTSAESVAFISVGDVIYDFVSDDTAKNNTAYSGAMPEGGTEITRVYAERGKAAAVVHYVDSKGNPLLDDTLDTQYIGSAYDVSKAKDVASIKKDGVIYDFVSESAGAAYTGTMPENGVEITRVYAERGKAAAVVHYVDGNHNTLQDDTTDIRYIGSPYDVADAQTMLEIIKDGILYRFIGDDTASTGTVYSGTMPQGGVEISRVYELVEYYYQIQYNYTGYDVEGNEIYTNTETGTVSVTTSSSKTVYPEASRQFDGYDFTLVSETEMTADLTGTSEDAPYVFVIEYEFTEKPDPALVNLPKTGDRGIGRWITLMAVASATLAMLIAPPRRRKAHR